MKIFVCDMESTAREDHGSGNEDLDTCKHCGITFTASCDCSSLSSQNGQAPTCTLAGWNNYYMCNNSDCGKIYGSDDKNGASYANEDEWKASSEGKINELGHEWRYSENGATLTATCNRDDSHTATLTLTASNANYSGTTYTGVSIKDSSNNLISDTTNNLWIKAGLTAPTVEYMIGETWGTTAPTAVGSYQVRIYPSGESQLASNTAVATFTINKADIASVTFTEPTAPAYGGTPASSVAGTGDTYSGAISWSPSATTFDYSTAYTATITLTADDNHKFASDVTIPSNWTKDNSSTETKLVLNRTYTTAAAAPHTCGSGEKQDGQAATCTADGFMDYYKCGSCDKLYKEAACTNEITDLDKWKATDGQGKIAKLGHSWGYKASGATLTATCSRDSSHTATLTLTASSANYSGKPYSGASLGDTSAWKGTGLAVPKMTYLGRGSTIYSESETAPTNIGTYTVQIYPVSEKIKPTHIAKVDFEIKKESVPEDNKEAKEDASSSSSDSQPSTPRYLPADYVPEKVAAEEGMEVTFVTMDNTNYDVSEKNVVPGSAYNLSKFTTTSGYVKGVRAAIAGSNILKKTTAEIYSGEPICFNKEIIKAIQDGKKTVIYYFQYKGHIYSVIIPPTVNAARVLEKTGFAGPLYVGLQLGTARLVK